MHRFTKFFRNLNIRAKLFGGYSAIFVLSLLLCSFVIYSLMRTTVETNIEREFQNSTAAILNMVRTTALRHPWLKWLKMLRKSTMLPAVLTLIGKGLSAGEIAETLHVSPKTIGTYRERLKAKLELKHGAELVRYAVLWVEFRMP